MLEPTLKILLAYLLGSIMGALWVGRILGHVDISTMGSGNAGGTNALRTQGWFFAFLVVVIDVGKGALAAGWVPKLSLAGIAPAASSSGAWLQFACAAAAVVGHVFPLYHGFRGGKGAATMAGALSIISWPALLVMIATWLVLTTLTGYVGLATMLATTSAATYAGIALGPRTPVFAFTLCMAVFILFTHRGNVARMFSGTENRSSRLMLFKPGSGGGHGDE